MLYCIQKYQVMPRQNSNMLCREKEHAVPRNTGTALMNWASYRFAKCFLFQFGKVLTIQYSTYNSIFPLLAEHTVYRSTKC